MNLRTGYALSAFMGLTVAVAAFSSSSFHLFQVGTSSDAPNRTSTGREINPIGAQTPVGSFPCNLVSSASGKYLLVTDSGYRENLGVIDVASGKLLSQLPAKPSLNSRNGVNLYFGIASKANADGSETVAASLGSKDQVLLSRLSPDGLLTSDKTISLPKNPNPMHIALQVAGLAWSADGAKLWIVANESHAFNGFHGSVYQYDVASDSFGQPVQVGSFPLSICALKDGSVVVTNEGDLAVTRIDENGATCQIETGEQPAYLSLNHAQSRLYVSNANGDTVSELDVATQKVLRTILVRPGGLRGFPGVTPLGSAISPDDKTLFVAVADLNAVAVIDLASGSVKGYVPSGWYPTSVAVSPDGSHLFVANAKGVQAKNPNGKPVKNWGQYDQNIIDGTVSMISTSEITKNLKSMTAVVQRSNHDFTPNKGEVNNPGIRHVVYIIKENRTYDQVLGDISGANGDPSLTLFGADVTPNQHALAKRFGIFDNFYVCAEVSADGWNWSSSGEANEYVERNVPYNYSGRGRAYDSEGVINDTPVDLDDMRDVGASAGGYLWDSILAKGLTVRNYGMFLTSGNDAIAPNGKPVAEDNLPDKKALVPVTCTDFRQFDLRFPDSDAWVKLGLAPAPQQIKTYGSHKDPSRFSTWEREFKQYVAKGDLPSLTLIRLPRDHTSGSSTGMSSARAMAADNDYAVGEVVDELSHSPFWSSSAVFVVEDDAQAGFDHVDCHRSNVLVVSPFLDKNRVNSSFYNTDSVLATIESLFKCKPNNQYLATARRFDLFHKGTSNDDPYGAIVPSKAILAEVNQRDAYRSADSTRLVNAMHEESDADFELNEILWRSIKGKNAPLPQTPGTVWHSSR